MSHAHADSVAPLCPPVRVQGAALDRLPEDLYIPPDALQVFLEAFEGPLDLLLYLIRKHNIDILDIPVAEITKQYVHYVDLMQELQLELAAEYLVMAAMLAEIKSRMLLPKPPAQEGVEPDDPRAELVRRLQIYEQFKQAAETLDALPRIDRDLLPTQVALPSIDQRLLPKADITALDLQQALAEVLKRAHLKARHQIVLEPLSIRERMTQVLSRVRQDKFTEFTAFFTPEEGRMGVVVTFIAILELIRQSALECVQAQPYAPIYVKAL